MWPIECALFTAVLFAKKNNIFVLPKWYPSFLKINNSQINMEINL